MHELWWVYHSDHHSPDRIWGSRSNRRSDADLADASSAARTPKDLLDPWYLLKPSAAALLQVCREACREARLGSQLAARMPPTFYEVRAAAMSRSKRSVSVAMLVTERAVGGWSWHGGRRVRDAVNCLEAGAASRSAVGAGPAATRQELRARYSLVRL